MGNQSTDISVITDIFIFASIYKETNQIDISHYSKTENSVKINLGL